MDGEDCVRWGATRGSLEIIRKRNESPETRRLVDKEHYDCDMIHTPNGLYLHLPVQTSTAEKKWWR